MRRKIYSELIKWKNGAKKKPLVIKGTRRVGKTYLALKFGEKEFDDYVFVNFEKDKALAGKLKSVSTLENLIEHLQSTRTKPILPNKTLIILDAIHACEQVITALEHFDKKTLEHHVMATYTPSAIKSLEKLDLVECNSTWRNLTMHQMDFEEFLWALKRDDVAQIIRKHYRRNSVNPIHNTASALCLKYMVTGGMPEAVAEFIRTGNFERVAVVQSRQLRANAADICGLFSPSVSFNVRACYESIPVQMLSNKDRFRYNVVHRAEGSDTFGTGIEWLIRTGLAYRSWRSSYGVEPMEDHVMPGQFKLFMSDISVLSYLLGASQQEMTTPLEYDSATTKLILHSLVAHTLASKSLQLYYWKNFYLEGVEFLIRKKGNVMPVEIRQTNKGLLRSKNMGYLLVKHHFDNAICVSPRNFRCEENVRSVPPYALFCL